MSLSTPRYTTCIPLVPFAVNVNPFGWPAAGGALVAAVRSSTFQFPGVGPGVGSGGGAGTGPESAFPIAFPQAPPGSNENCQPMTPPNWRPWLACSGAITLLIMSSSGIYPSLAPAAVTGTPTNSFCAPVMAAILLYHVNLVGASLS